MYGVTYRWNSNPTNATLVPEEGLDEPFVIRDGGTVRTQVWHYPARGECLRCHTQVGGYALGFNAPQLNRSFDYSSAVTNQIMALSQAGYFTSPVTNTGNWPVMAHATNTAFSVEQ